MVIALDSARLDIPARDGVVVSIPVEDASDARPPPGGCVADDPSAWNAFSILAALPANKATGSVFLSDSSGWLRFVLRPGDHPAQELLAKLRDTTSHPVETSSGGPHEHHH